MKRRRRLLLRIGLGLLGALLLVLLLIPVAVGVLLTTHSGTRPQDRALTAAPWDYRLSYRSVFLRAADGVPISAWVLRPPGEAGADCSVVLAHGLFRSRRELLPRAARLARRGCVVALPDLRNHGASGSARSTLGFHERFDVLAAGDFLREAHPGRRLYFLGVSMGGAAAVGAAAEAGEPPAGVVLDSTFRNAPEAVARYTNLLLHIPAFGTRDLVLLGMRLSAGFRPRAMDVEALSRRLGERGVPVLVIGGSADRRAPIADQEAVFRANGHPASRFVTVPGAMHGRPCLESPEVCEAAVARFLDLDPAPPKGTPAASARGVPYGRRAADGPRQDAPDLVPTLVNRP